MDYLSIFTIPDDKSISVDIFRATLFNKNINCNASIIVFQEPNVFECDCTITNPLFKGKRLRFVSRASRMYSEYRIDSMVKHVDIFPDTDTITIKYSFLEKAFVCATPDSDESIPITYPTDEYNFSIVYLTTELSLLVLDKDTEMLVSKNEQ